MNLHSLPLLRYPRTAHLAGSRLQADDSAHDQTPLAALADCHVVIEEKLDGANAGLSFSEGGDLLLQSRGHYLSGGLGERQFNLFKVFAAAHEARLLERLEDRYVMYGEWLYAKHSIWYDRLPHWLHEFDVYDRHEGVFLSTPRRHALLAGSPILSVPVLYEGPMPTQPQWLWSLVRPSLAKSAQWRPAFEDAVRREGLALPLAWQQTDKADQSEGLYLKVEDAHQVRARYKLVRPSFTQTILEAGDHHTQRPLLPNQLAAGVDVFHEVPTLNWRDLGLVTLTSLEALKSAVRGLPPNKAHRS
ncbi:RNA ligase family protein [Roseateles sp. SL47]|uniref:RNA ligase family protein n=1 Tax=Roseateles sp. SL47 TaxID=2995138 RepID=UPI00226DE82C|nr:RNA ligase family protein [Roseateles sp. SL47]WAC74808.1 RNA ligase family protein [Roseateles sp. SL47]